MNLRRSLLSLPLLFCLVPSCSVDSTSLVVVVQSDYAVGQKMLALDVQLLSQDGALLAHHSFELQNADALPLSFAIAPFPDEPTPHLFLTAIGQDSVVLSTRDIQVSFEPDIALRLPVFLPAACENIVCSEGQSCGLSGCAPAHVPSSDLDMVEPGAELTASCTPGERRCSRSNLGVQICDPTGLFFDYSACAQSCGEGRCSEEEEDEQHELTVSAEGVVIVSTPEGIRCPGDCSDIFDENEVVTLSAESPTLVIWGGACQGVAEDQSWKVTMSQAQQITATSFNNEPLLSVRMQGNGRIVSTPVGIDCGASCDVPFPSNTRVRLRAEPGLNQLFNGWSGPCDTPDGPHGDCELTVVDDVQVTALFGSESQAFLRVVFQGTGSGRVTSTPPGIDCPGQCESPFPQGTQVSLQATPDPSSNFYGFSSPCPDPLNCTLVLNGLVEVFAPFEPIVNAQSDRFDLNGDGLADIAVAAPSMDLGMVDAGRVYIRLSPHQPQHVDASAMPYSLDGETLGAELGTAIAFTGDLDDDGFADLAIGAPGAFMGRGAVYILRGGPQLNPSGPVGRSTDVIMGENIGDAFGASLRGGGDLNNDGYPDLIVGAPGRDPMRNGQVYLFFGGPVLMGQIPASASEAPVRLIGELPGDAFGESLDFANDVNGDGWNDVLVGAPKWRRMMNATIEVLGRAYVFFGGPGPAEQYAFNAGHIVEGSLSMGGFGRQVTTLGDWDQDGFADFAVSEPQYAQVFIYHGGRTEQFQTSVASFTGGPSFGTSLLGGHDFDGDHLPDLVIGAPEWETSGLVEMWQGPASTTPDVIVFWSECHMLPSCGSEHLGVSLGVAGDLDQNGFPELIVGSIYGAGPSGQPGRGRVGIYATGPELVGVRSDQVPMMITGENQADGRLTSVSR